MAIAMTAAEELGWRSEQVRIIDEDQGLSGKASAGRDGFQDLVIEVSLGHVGIVFGYQVSRLARNNADWYHLLDLAAVFDTLIADADGVYNLRDYNDRLILGLKGTMSEAELHWLRQRLDDGRMNKVRRGEYRQCLPTGLVRLDDGTVIDHSLVEQLVEIDMDTLSGRINIRPRSTEPQVALIDRGACFFSDKGSNAEAAGYEGYIIANNAGDGLINMSAGDPPLPTIPGVFIGHRRRCWR